MKTLKDKNNKMKNKSGFTIIEVVLVLAIAGLIFLMIFLALPALQRAQRNQQYKNNVSAGVAMVEKYKSNNKNSFLPARGDMRCTVGELTDSCRNESVREYINNAGFSDGTIVRIIAGGSSHNGYTSLRGYDYVIGQVTIVSGSQCVENSGAAYGFLMKEAGSSQGAVFTALENGSKDGDNNGLIYCQNID